MAYNVEELRGKTADELIAIVESQQKQLSEKPAAEPAKPAEPAPAAEPVKPAEPAKELAEPAKPVVETVKPAEPSEIKRLSDEIEALREDKRIALAEKRLSEIAGLPPVVVEKARQIVLADKAAPKIFKLSEKNGEGMVAERQVSLTDSVFAILESVPKIQLGEQASGASESPAENVADADLAKVKKFAEDSKVDFRSAFRTLVAKGEIKPPNYSKILPE